MKGNSQLFHDLHSLMNTAWSSRRNCPSDICSAMNSEQAKNLVKAQTPLIKQCVCNRCGDDKHLIPLALLYVNQRLSEQDWQLIRQYDDKRPFEKFIRELAEDALEVFFHGVWFGKCARTIQYWITRYGIDIVYLVVATALRRRVRSDRNVMTPNIDFRKIEYSGGLWKTRRQSAVATTLFG